MRVRPTGALPSWTKPELSFRRFADIIRARVPAPGSGEPAGRERTDGTRGANQNTCSSSLAQHRWQTIPNIDGLSNSGPIGHARLVL